MRGLRLPRHRATTAHLASAYLFADAAAPGTAGVLMGVDVLSGAAFAYDPFEAYRAGLVTNPNVLVAGEPGTGKSATVKCLLHRAAGVLGRWVAVADPKGEYGGLAGALGLDVVRLAPGGPARVNPLDPVPGAGPEDAARRRSATVAALIGSVLGRDLAPLEDAAVGWALERLGRGGARPTLVELAGALADPDPGDAARARVAPAELARATLPLVWALGKLLEGSLRGMFDGPTNVGLGAGAGGLVLDLSAVHQDPEALAVVMVAATSWLQAALVRPGGPPAVQVLDEAWCLLAAERTARYLQACWKLGRAFGVANLAVVHRLSDLRAQADDGTAAAKVAAGLLADTQTRVLFRQAPDQLGEARALLGLTGTEAEVVGRLCRGRALWKVGGRSAVVQHVVTSAEAAFCDTDAAMGAA